MIDALNVTYIMLKKQIDGRILKDMKKNIGLVIKEKYSTGRTMKKNGKLKNPEETAMDIIMLGSPNLGKKKIYMCTD